MSVKIKHPKVFIVAVLVLALIVVLVALGLWALFKGQRSQTRQLLQQTQEQSATLGTHLTETATANTQVVTKTVDEIRKTQGSTIPEDLRQKLISGETEGLKVAFLSFDDGPTEHTPEVLDILKKHKVKATFFVNGRSSPEMQAMYKRIVDEGHTLANHTYSHDYGNYDNTAALIGDIKNLQREMDATTGTVSSGIFRFPGGSPMANAEQVAAVKNAGYNYADWNVSFGDGSSQPLPTPDVVARVVGSSEAFNVATILGHPETDSKVTSREALPQIITELKKRGYTFLPMEKEFQYPQHYEGN